MQDLQARIKEKDERMAELLTLREELENERRRAEELRMEMERSHEMEQSERQRLVSCSVLFCLFVLFCTEKFNQISETFGAEVICRSCSDF